MSITDTADRLNFNGRVAQVFDQIMREA